MKRYYVHPESGSAFAENEDVDVFGCDDTGCLMEVDRAQYLRACGEFGIDPEECRYCADTGWFYGDRELGMFCGCERGTRLAAMFEDLLG